ncbi:hypothetical protein SAMN05421595_1694 [Austwickia chelonae]|nr:hypothetical protein SAMN05421595_1694 [Austwickia chelonae]
MTPVMVFGPMVTQRICLAKDFGTSCRLWHNGKSRLELCSAPTTGGCVALAVNGVAHAALASAVHR